MCILVIEIRINKIWSNISVIHIIISHKSHIKLVYTSLCINSILLLTNAQNKYGMLSSCSNKYVPHYLNEALSSRRLLSLWISRVLCTLNQTSPIQYIHKILNPRTEFLHKTYCTTKTHDSYSTTLFINGRGVTVWSVVCTKDTRCNAFIKLHCRNVSVFF